MSYKGISKIAHGLLQAAQPRGESIGTLPMLHGRGSYTIVGGLLVSQLLTLYTTPVVYLYLDRLSRGWRRPERRSEPVPNAMV